MLILLLQLQGKNNRKKVFTISVHWEAANWSPKIPKFLCGQGFFVPLDPPAGRWPCTPLGPRWPMDPGHLGSILPKHRFQFPCLHYLFAFSFSYTRLAFLFSPRCFFAGGWLLLKPNSSSDILWNEFAWVWKVIPDRKSEAVDFDSKWKGTKDESSRR